MLSKRKSIIFKYGRKNNPGKEYQYLKMSIKKIISVIMLVMIISHGMYQLFIFKILQAKYREEISQLITDGIPEDMLKLLRFSKNDFENGTAGFEWIEDDEIRIDEKLFDIVKKDVKGDSIYLYCIYDENESVLYANMEIIMDRLIKDDPDKARDLQSFSFSISQFYSKPSDIYNNSRAPGDMSYFFNIPSKLIEREYIPPTPPPRV